MKIASVALDVVYGQPERSEQLSERGPWADSGAIDKRACRVEEGGFIIRGDAVYGAFISFTQFDTFMAITGSSDENTARFWVDAAGGNVELAVSNFLNGNNAGGGAAPPPQDDSE